MKVKIFTYINDKFLEMEINKWIEEHKYKIIIDIKYQIIKRKDIDWKDTGLSYSAMIIYK